MQNKIKTAFNALFFQVPEAIVYSPPVVPVAATQKRMQ